MAEDMSYAESAVQPEWSGYSMTRSHYPSRDGSWTWQVVRNGRDGRTQEIALAYRAPDCRVYIVQNLDGTPVPNKDGTMPDWAVMHQSRTHAWQYAIELFEAGQLPIKP